jgi:hypothetical protein
MKIIEVFLSKTTKVLQASSCSIDSHFFILYCPWFYKSNSDFSLSKLEFIEKKWYTVELWYFEHWYLGCHEYVEVI